MTDPDVKNLRKLVKKVRDRAQQERIQAALDWNRAVAQHMAMRRSFGGELPTPLPWHERLRRWVRSEEGEY